MKKKKAEDLIDFHLRHAWHKISRMYNQKAKVHGLTMSIGFILLIVDKNGTPSTQLGPKMGMEPTSLSRTLKTMESKGWITRKIDQEDKRKVLIFLTQEGLVLRKEVKEVVLSFNEKIEKVIPSSEMEIFLKVLAQIDITVENEITEMLSNQKSSI
ncbi:MAG: MarR family transcriptional regulator [Crocinitomicaceae bacterium]|nr:MarR family transcriptional regulator [Crocinitomicaceae bacterium]